MTPSPVLHAPNFHPHSTTVDIREENAVHELSTRVARSAEICKNRGLFANDNLWRKRARACIEATALLVFCANAKPAWFGDISTLLGEIGSSEEIRELSLRGTDELFTTRWTCLSLVAIRPILERNMLYHVMRAIDQITMEDDTGNSDALAAARKIDETLQKAWDCLFRLYDALRNTEDLTEEVLEILGGYESQISELEQINIEADGLEQVDSAILQVQYKINQDSHQIISQFPGVFDDFEPHHSALIPFGRLAELSKEPHKLQFTCPRMILKSMCSPCLTLRNILEGQGDADTYKELLENLENLPFSSGWQGDGMQPRQLWRLQDLCDGGALGFTVELFFLALSRPLSTSSSDESHSALYMGTFRAITSDWSKHQNSPGTQNLLLDIAWSHRLEFENKYPAYIVDEFLLLLRNIFKGQIGLHVDRARQQFESFPMFTSRRFRERVLEIIAQVQTQPL